MQCRLPNTANMIPSSKASKGCKQHGRPPQILFRTSKLFGCTPSVTLKRLLGFFTVKTTTNLTLFRYLRHIFLFTRTGCAKLAIKRTLNPDSHFLSKMTLNKIPADIPDPLPDFPTPSSHRSPSRRETILSLVEMLLQEPDGQRTSKFCLYPNFVLISTT